MQRNKDVDRTYAWLLPLMTAGLIVGIALGRLAEEWWYAAAALVCSLAAAMLIPGRVRMLSLTVAAAALGAWMAYGAYHPVRPAEGEYIVSGVIIQEVSVEKNGHVKTILDDVTLNGEATGERAYWSWYLQNGEEWTCDYEGFEPGVYVSFAAEVYHPGGAENPGGFDFNEYLLQRNIRFGLYGADELCVGKGPFSLSGFLASVRHRLTLFLMDAMGEEGGAYAAAILLGSRDYIQAEDMAAFQDIGMAHVLSVSGWHVGILAMLIGVLFRPTRLPRGMKVGVQALIFAGYAMLTGGNAPVVRAALLLLLREVGMLRRHRNLSLHLLCVSAAVQLCAAPAQLMSASFQLTYSAIAGILLVNPWLKRRFSPVSPSLAKVWETFSVALSAQIGILPVQLYWFGELPVLSLVMNVALMGLMSGVMTLFWVTLAVLPVPLLGKALASAVGQLTAWLLAGIRALAGVAGMSLWTKEPEWFAFIGWLMLIAGLSVLLPERSVRHRRRLILIGVIILLAGLVPIPHRGTEWMQMSVGEADAALLWDDEQVIVVDAGEEPNDLHYYLRDQRLSVDLLILTHLHSDHAGGAAAFVDMLIPVERCVLPVDAEKAAEMDESLLDALDRLRETGTEIVHASRGDEIDLPNGRMTVLWPQKGTVRPGQDANASCLVLLADIRGTAMLLMGDLTSTYEMYCAEPADILKAAHHGSKASTSQAFLNQVGPQVILLSCGTAERERSLADRAGDIPVYSTESQGAITVHFQDEHFTVEIYLPEKKFSGRDKF